MGWRHASPGRKAGCGLKHRVGCGSRHSFQASPGRKAGCGLKHRRVVDDVQAHFRITRPKGRVRIETPAACSASGTWRASPGRKAGCGLKRSGAGVRHAARRASPGRKAGCGLKRHRERLDAESMEHHPAERPGAD